MKHLSVPSNQSCEFINVESISPLISKCQIKVCYVDTAPNRNKSILTKETAAQMAGTLRGCPIVGKYNFTKQDFEEHNRILRFENGQWTFDADTIPYGFVDLNAKVWFQKFLDDNEVEREYLVTEGYIWTGQYPEAARCITQGNNHSMELDEKTLQGEWTKDRNGEPQFFIINDGLFSKLCILGDDEEPCFEGSQINVHFNLKDNNEFAQTFYSMMDELKTILNEGGQIAMDNAITAYAVEIGDNLWSALYTALEVAYPDIEEGSSTSLFYIRGVYEEEGQKFMIIEPKKDASKLFRVNFSYTEKGIILGELVQVAMKFVELNPLQFSLEDTLEYSKKVDKTEKEEEDKKEDNVEDEEKDKDDNKEEKEEEEKKKTDYSLEDVVEYQDLLVQYSALQEECEALKAENEALSSQIAPLTEFKNKAELKEKEDMINSFYMLSDEDKLDVKENIATYSLSDIEAKLAIICVRNKVDFSLNEEEKEEAEKQPTSTFNVNTASEMESDIPEWLKAVDKVQKQLQ